MNRDKFVFEASKLRPTKNFLRINGLKTDCGAEIFANIVFNVSYKNAIEESLRALKGYFPMDSRYVAAKAELIGKFRAALISMSEQKVADDEPHFLPLTDEKRRRIDGIRFHQPSSTLHIFALVQKKTISSPGNEYGKGVPRYSTIVEVFKKICPALKFESMTISPWQVESIKVESLFLLEGD